MDWLRAARADEIANGHFRFINTNLEYGDDGIKGLRHCIPLAQQEWLHDGTAGHTKSDQYDSGSSRIMTRITSTGAATSRMRKRVLLPRDFWKFPTIGFEFVVRGSSPLPTAVTMTVRLYGTADGSVNDANIKPAVASVFEVKALSITDSTYFSADFITLEFKMQSSGAGEWAEIGDIELGYITARGNI